MSLSNSNNPPPLPKPNQVPPPIFRPCPPPDVRATVPLAVVCPPHARRVRLNYTIKEKLNFLQIMEEVLPIGPDECEHVASRLH